jgi:hypothetical protein
MKILKSKEICKKFAEKKEKKPKKNKMKLLRKDGRQRKLVLKIKKKKNYSTKMSSLKKIKGSLTLKIRDLITMIMLKVLSVFLTICTAKITPLTDSKTVRV